MYSKLLIKLINHNGMWIVYFISTGLNLDEAIGYEWQHTEYPRSSVFIIPFFYN
jgi:hypothetical protein